MKKIYVIEASVDPEYYPYHLLTHHFYKDKKVAEEFALKISEQLKVISPKYNARATELKLVDC